ncbi:MAG: sugar ABC transporter permease [Chloroflexi bacterium]|nr:sugar ABC transporter permease [Chloroflexota bacterium]
MIRRRSVAERRPAFGVVWGRHWMLYLMLAPAAVWLVLFHFYPLWGIAVAFLDYSPFRGVSGSPYVGLDNFRRFFDSPDAFSIIRNTIFIALAKIAMGQVAAVAFALTLNEVRVMLFRRMMQTATTLPHFISWVLIGGILIEMLSSDGVVNRGITALGGQAIRFLGSAQLFPWTLIVSETWKEFGWNAVIYLAALTAISPELYEAAGVDGAGRWARTRHISLPGITPIIVLLSCLSLGGILNAGFEQVLVFLNPMVYSTGDILDTYIYRVGLLGGELSLGAAVGLFKGVIGFLLILLSYWLADKLANYRIF